MNCDCGCNGHDHDDSIKTITLTLDDGTEMECEVLGNFNLEGTDYIVLSPDGDDEVLIYRYKEEGEPTRRLYQEEWSSGADQGCTFTY